VEDAAVVEPLRLPVLDALLHVEQVGAADQVVELADADLRHQFAQFFGDEEEVIDDVLGLAGEACGAAPDPASRRRPGRC
jgi:hypothetical protein